MQKTFNKIPLSLRNVVAMSAKTTDKLLHFDVLKFINAVRSHKPLWDKSDAEYSNRRTRDEAWDAVGKEMFPDWEEATKNQRNIKVAMKNKWRNLRDYINKNRKKKGARSSSVPYYFSLLEDLISKPDKTIQGPEEVNVLYVDDEAAVDDEEFQDDEEPNAQGKRMLARDVDETTTKQTPDPPVGVQKQPKLNKNHHRPTVVDSSDSDYLFLLSMIDDVRIMTDTEKLDFKMMCLQFFKNVRQRRELVNNAMPLMNYGANNHYFSNNSLANSSNFNHNPNYFPVQSNFHHNPNSFPVQTSLHHQQNSQQGSSTRNGLVGQTDQTEGNQNQNLPRVENVFSMCEL